MELFHPKGRKIEFIHILKNDIKSVSWVEKSCEVVCVISDDDWAFWNALTHRVLGNITVRALSI